MTKAELVARIAKDAKISKRAAEVAVDSFTGAVRDSLKKGKRVGLVGFGTFSVGRRAARNGRNPQTGEAIKIKAMRIPKFKAGKALKAAVR
jgi:DNA-binding protein HU-beta